MNPDPQLARNQNVCAKVSGPLKQKLTRAAAAKGIGLSALIADILEAAEPLKITGK